MDKLHWNAYPSYKQVKREICLAELEFTLN